MISPHSWRRALRRVNIAGLLTIIVCLGLWELAIRAGILRYQYLPAPSAIAAGAEELAARGELSAAVLHTLEAVLLGWTIATTLGVSFGLVLGSSQLARRYSLSTIEVLRPMPAIAFIPVALLLFGFSTATELTVIVLPALWPVLVGTMQSVMNIHPRLRDVARTFRLRRVPTMIKILLPAAAPGIMVGARISLTLALVLAVLAEMVGNPEGLGYGVVSEQQALRPDLMFAYVVVIGFLGIALNALLVGALTGLSPATAAALEGRSS